MRNPLVERKIQIDGKEYYLVSTFALITHRTYQAVLGLIKDGNSIRKLRVRYLAEKPLVPAEELTEFPFTDAGRPREGETKTPYYFDANGEEIDA